MNRLTAKDVPKIMVDGELFLSRNKSKKSVAGSSVRSKRSNRSNRKDKKNEQERQKNKPQRLNDLPPKTPPLENEKDLRKYIERKKERQALEKEKEE